MKQRIERLLRSTDREGIEDLLEYMDANGYYSAPCSTKYHLCVAGGLAEHSYNVWCAMALLKNAFANSLPKNIGTDSLIIVTLLHDLGKMGNFDKPLYTDNVLKSGKVSEAEPFKHNPDALNIPHSINSVLIASNFIKLTEEETHAIIYHNGKYDKLGYELKDETPLMLMLHFCDMWVSRFIEGKNSSDWHEEDELDGI